MRIFTLILLLTTALAASAQTKEIRLKVITDIPGPLHFSAITVIDSRPDTSAAGWVTKGLDNLLVPAVFEKSAAESIESVCQEATKAIWQPGKDELVLHLTDLFLYEDPRQIGTDGVLDLRIQAFLRRGEQYFPLHKTDTQISFKSFDVTQKMFRELNRLLLETVHYANQRFPQLNTSYPLSWSQVMQIRTNELQSRYALYGDRKPVDGVYFDIRSFLDQAPSADLQELNNIINKNESLPKRKRQALFGFCRDGRIYVFTGNRNDSTELYRRNGSFFKQDWGLDPQLQQASAAMGWLFGFGAEVATSLVNNKDRAWYEFIFNPRTALFNHYGRLAETREEYARQQQQAAGGEAGNGTN